MPGAMGGVSRCQTPAPKIPHRAAARRPRGARRSSLDGDFPRFLLDLEGGAGAWVPWALLPMGGAPRCQTPTPKPSRQVSPRRSLGVWREGVDGFFPWRYLSDRAKGEMLPNSK